MLCDCPDVGYWQELMMVKLYEHGAYLDDRETTIAILNSHKAVAHKEITGLLQTIPFPEPNS